MKKIPYIGGFALTGFGLGTVLRGEPAGLLALYFGIENYAWVFWKNKLTDGPFPLTRYACNTAKRNLYDISKKLVQRIKKTHKYR